MSDLKSRSQIKRVAATDPFRIIEEFEKLRAAVKSAKALAKVCIEPQFDTETNRLLLDADVLDRIDTAGNDWLKKYGDLV